MSHGPTLIIANPEAGGGRLGARRAQVEAKVNARWPDATWHWTDHAAHASELAAAAAGATTVLSIGGDGTHGQVVDGLMRIATAARPTLGILPAGTGGDFARALYGEPTLDAALAHLHTHAAARIDLGFATWVSDEGAPRSAHFLNCASVGLGGLVDRAVAKSPKRLLGRSTYLLSTLWAVARFRAPRVEVLVDGASVGTYVVSNVFACNGPFAGGGMAWAPEAKVSDGILDFLLIEDRSLPAAVKLVPAVYGGTLGAQPGVHRWRGTSLEVRPVEGDAWLDLDGDAPGRAPFTTRIVPSALALLGARSA
jgi:YegS/Rv2252/BmrU family lipid kinase